MVTGIRNKFAEGTVSNFGDVFGNFESQNANYRNVQEQNKVAKAQTQAEQIKQKNLQTAWKIGMTHNLTPEQFQNELVLANVHNTPEGKGALEQYTKMAKPLQDKSAETQKQIDFLSGPATRAAFAPAKEAEQQYNALPEAQRSPEAASDAAQKDFLSKSEPTTMANVDQQYDDTLQAGQKAANAVPTGISFRPPTGAEERTLALSQQALSGSPMKDVYTGLEDAGKQEQLYGNKKELAEMQYANKEKLQAQKPLPVPKTPTLKTPSGPRGITPAAGARLSQQKDQFEEKQWQALAKSINQLTSTSRSVVGQAATANLRGIRALDRLKSATTPQDLQLVNVDIAGIMKGGVPDKEEMQTTNYQNLATKWANLQQYLLSKPVNVDVPEVKKKLTDIITGFMEIDNNVFEKNTGVAKAAFSKIIKKDPQRFSQMVSSLSNTPPTGATGIQPQQPAGTAQSPAATKGTKTYTPDQARGLPKGTRFMGTDGKTHTKL
jgi:hypothetical protein